MPSRQNHRHYTANPKPAPKPTDRQTLCIGCAHRFDPNFQCPTSAKTERRNGLFIVLECEGFEQVEAEPVTA